MSDFGESAVEEMARAYLEALIAFERNGDEEWVGVSVDDVDPLTRDLVLEDCCRFLGLATATTGMVHLDVLLKAIDASDLGWYFFMTRAETGLCFDGPKYASFGSDLNELAAEFGNVRYFVQAGRVHRDVPRSVEGIEPMPISV